jgi:hypothetical protein
MLFSLPHVPSASHKYAARFGMVEITQVFGIRFKVPNLYPMKGATLAKQFVPRIDDLRLAGVMNRLSVSQVYYYLVEVKIKLFLIIRRCTS